MIKLEIITITITIFLSASENDSAKLLGYIGRTDSISEKVHDHSKASYMMLHHNVWVEKYHPDWWDDNELLSNPYESYDALDVERYIYDEIVKDDSNLNSENSVNLIFLKP